jgi:multiple antibiotic resistance protein
MSEFLSSRWVSDVLFAFSALFAIINPYGLAFIFHGRTVALTERERARVALRVAFYAFGVLLVSLFAGSHILRFFGISMPALRIGGGLVVAATGWSMLHAEPSSQDGHSTSTANFEAIQQMAFFPLTIPLTTGPGTIATAIAIGTSRTDHVDGVFYSFIVLMIAAIGVTATIYHAYTRASVMARLFGEVGTSVITRLSAFLLLCVGVQIIITGVEEIARSLAP